MGISTSSCRISRNPSGTAWHSSALFMNDNVATQIDSLSHATQGDNNHWYNGFEEAQKQELPMVPARLGQKAFYKVLVADTTRRPSEAAVMYADAGDARKTAAPATSQPARPADGAAASASAAVTGRS
mgnify:CR=1 FL=1